MAHTPDQIETTLRMLLEGKTFQQISADLFGREDSTQPATGIWNYFKHSQLLNPKYASVEDLKTALEARGLSLSTVELNQLKALSNSANRNRSHTVRMKAQRSRTALDNTSDKRAAPQPTTLTHERLVREGIPYAMAADDACSQPVFGKEPKGYVCGEPIGPARFRNGKTTCKECEDLTRTAPRPGAEVQRQGFKPYNPSR